MVYLHFHHIFDLIKLNGCFFFFKKLSTIIKLNNKYYYIKISWKKKKKNKINKKRMQKKVQQSKLINEFGSKLYKTKNLYESNKKLCD